MNGTRALLGLVAAALMAGSPVREARAQAGDAFSNLTQLVTSGAYLAGLGFSIGAIMKFKQHKDNPTQVPIGTPVGAIAVFLAADKLSNTFSCPVFVGSGTLLGEDTCVWSKVTGSLGSQGTAATQGLDWRVGGQLEVAPGWFVGGTLGTGATFSQTAGAAESGRSYDGAVVVKRVAGPLYLAGALGVAFASDQTAWSNPAGVSSGVNTFNAGAVLRGAWEVTLDPVYLRPRLDIGLGLMNQSGQQLSGTSAAVSVDPVSKLGLHVTPMLEFGGRHDIGSVILRPYVAAGPRWLPDNAVHVSGNVAGTPVAGDLGGPNVLAVVEAGLQAYEAKSWEIKLEYRLVAADQYLDQSLGLRAAKHF